MAQEQAPEDKVGDTSLDAGRQWGLFPLLFHLWRWREFSNRLGSADEILDFINRLLGLTMRISQTVLRCTIN